MLTLRRLPGESVTLEYESEFGPKSDYALITVTVVAVEGKSVTLGIDAPKSVAILRDDAREKEKKA